MAVTGTNQTCKRVFDLLCTSFILVLLSPLLLVVALAIKLLRPVGSSSSNSVWGCTGKYFGCINSAAWFPTL